MQSQAAVLLPVALLARRGLRRLLPSYAGAHHGMVARLHSCSLGRRCFCPSPCSLVAGCAGSYRPTLARTTVWWRGCTRAGSCGGALACRPVRSSRAALAFTPCLLHAGCAGIVALARRAGFRAGAHRRVAHALSRITVRLRCSSTGVHHACSTALSSLLCTSLSSSLHTRRIQCVGWNYLPSLDCIAALSQQTLLEVDVLLALANVQGQLRPYSKRKGYATMEASCLP